MNTLIKQYCDDRVAEFSLIDENRKADLLKLYKSYRNHDTCEISFRAHTL